MSRRTGSPSYGEPTVAATNTRPEYRIKSASQPSLLAKGMSPRSIRRARRTEFLEQLSTAIARGHDILDCLRVLFMEGEALAAVSRDCVKTIVPLQRDLKPKGPLANAPRSPDHGAALSEFLACGNVLAERHVATFPTRRQQRLIKSVVQVLDNESCRAIGKGHINSIGVCRRRTSH